MEYQVWLNGEFMPRSEAKLGLTDRGLRLAVTWSSIPLAPSMARSFASKTTSTASTAPSPTSASTPA